MWSFFSRDPTKDLAYEIGEQVPGLQDKSIWSLLDGKHKVCVYDLDCDHRLKLVQHDVAQVIQHFE